MEISQFFVGGEWRKSQKHKPVINPYDCKTVGEVYQASQNDIQDAIRSAEAASAATRRLQSYERTEILAFIAGEIAAKKESFAQLITAETGKPITSSRAEVERSIFTFTAASEEARRIEGSVLPLDLALHSKSRFGLVRRFPLGPIGAITPFNFPINLIAHKVAPAIAAGNTIILKPSSNAPLTALLLAEVISRSGLPQGGFNIVPCPTNEARQLVTDERIRLITFTGSSAVGWGIKAQAGKKRVTLELGGNAGVIVDRGFKLDHITKRIAQGSYGNAGQSCISVQRIYVHEDIYDEFADLFVMESKSTQMGDPRDERTVVGPMISEEAAVKAECWIKEAVDGGAHILCGGKRERAMLEPTVLVDVKPEMNVSCHEVFAPVVTLDRFRDFKQAVGAVNNSAYGLQAGVFSKDLNNVFYAYDELEVGGVIVNDFPTYRIDSMPYGGVKDSGFGREGLRYAIEEMTEMKLLAFNLA
jgi:glyceraldehyde-3-phosphate dehydrogenase (NADP+)